MTSNGTNGQGLNPEQMRAAIASLATPDNIESPFGTLRFFDGVPRPRQSRRSTTRWISCVESKHS